MEALVWETILMRGGEVRFTTEGDSIASEEGGGVVYSKQSKG
jgi:hypothetical protein